MASVSITSASAALALAALSLSSTAAQAQDEPIVHIPNLSAPTALSLASTAYEDCTARGHRVSVAVVSRGGKLLAYISNPDAGPHTEKVAQGKAFTANTFRTATTALQANPDNVAFMSRIPGALIIGGGLPINLGGYHYGAVGVSGAPRDKTPGDVDDLCAQVGIDAIAADVEMAQ